MIKEKECIDCGVINDEVITRLDPYAQIVLNEHEDIDVCDSCLDKRFKSLN